MLTSYALNKHIYLSLSNFSLWLFQKKLPKKETLLCHIHFSKIQFCSKPSTIYFYKRNMGLFISNLVWESIFDIGKWFN